MQITQGAARRRRLRRWSIALTLLTVLVVLSVVAGPAAATPLEPTMTTARLTELLAASPTGTIDGYFKTTVKGATIVDIPCTIEGIVPQAAADNGDLIMFQASGPWIDEAGGIAAGMSGSPVYVNDGGSDLLVGAVSYGEYFTSNGLGLATPIEHMMEIETDFTIDPLSARLVRTATLAQPVKVAGKTVSAVAVAPTTRAARRAQAGAHTVVMRPLSTMLIGGLATDTAAWRKLKSDLADEGIDIGGGLAAGAAGSEPTFETPLVPGSSVGMLYMRGDYWYGGVGTTTYTTADDLLVAFGHPMDYEGETSAYMTNADVIGLWNNAEEAHKVVAPGKVRGTITVDSGAGIAGVIGTTPAEVPFTCTATNAATGKTVTRTSYATQYAADQFKWPYWDITAMSFYPALYQATGDQQYNGRLDYTLTIDVTNGTDDYTITRHNVWEDSYGWDCSYLGVTELASLFTTLTRDPDGTIDMHIRSITLDATLSPQLDHSRVVDVSVPGGIKTGLNSVRVKYYHYGSTVAQTVDVPLTIPKGMSTRGTFYAKAPYTNVESMGDGWYGWWSSYTQNNAPPQTLAEVVDGLNGARGNNMLLVAYDPPGDYNEDDWGEGEPWGDEAIIASADLDAYLTGEIAKSQARMTLRYSGGRPVTGRRITLRGRIGADSDLAGQTVHIYKREAGETTDTLVKDVPITGSDQNVFVAGLPDGAAHNATFTAVWDGDDTYITTSDSVKVKVLAKVGLTARAAGRTVRLVARVKPADTGGYVAFKRLVGERYRLIRKVAVDAAGKATCSFTGTSGANRVVAVFLGSHSNAGASSAVKVVKTK